MMKVSGQKIKTETILLSILLDKVNWLCWTKTKGAEKGKNRPEPITEKLLGKGKEKEEEKMAFDSAEEFEAALKRFGG